MPRKKKKEESEEKVSSELITDKRILSPFGSRTFQILLFVIAAIAVGVSIFFFLKYLDASKNASKKSGPNSVGVVSKVGKLMELPKGETPTIATVSDIKKLAGQPFFVDAKNGDTVLIYTNAGKAILYRPQTNKIVNVTSISPENQVSLQATPQPSISQSPAASTSLKVIILNGTKKAALTKTGETAIRKEGMDIEVVSRGNAEEDYQTSLVVDLTGQNSGAAEKIANIVKGKVGKLPAEEEKPIDTDVLIILGQSFTE